MLEDQLRAIPFLRDVDADTLRAVAGCLRPVRFDGGAVVFAAGDVADALLLVEAGALDVLEPRTGKVLASLSQGSVVGELGVLLGDPRSADVRAATDVHAWQLRREDLDRLLAGDPTLAVALGREVGRRLVATSRSSSTPPPRLVAVAAPDVAALTASLVDEGVHHVGVLPLAPLTDPVPAGAELLTGPFDADAVAQLAAAPGESDEAVIVLGLPPDASAAAEVGARASEFGATVSRTLPAWASQLIPALRQVSPRPGPDAMARLARRVSGRAVAVAFSSGGSKTVAHVGVVRVLREAGIPIDAVAGTSGGSVVAAAVARQIDDDELLRWVRQLAPAFRFRQLGAKIPPRRALFAGRGPLELFRSWHGGDRIEHCPIPLYVLAAELTSGAEVVLHRGEIADAIRASASIPGVLEPCPHDGRELVDGGIVAPLPARVLRDAGFRWVIGSNVAGQPPLEVAGRRPPGIVETMARMVSTMEREVLSSQVHLLDVHIRPLVRASNSFDFGAADRFVEEGVRAAEAELPALERLVEAARR